MEYQEYNCSNKNEVLLLLNSKNNEDIIKGILGMVNGISDTSWLQSKIIPFINHSDLWVSKSAINALGDIARIHGELDREKINSELVKIIRPDMLGVLEDFRDDIDMYLE